MPDPLVLLPGMNCTEQLWSPMLEALRGHGVAPETITPEVDAESVDAAVDGLLASLPDRFALAGLSLGGILAMAIHRRAPQRVSRIALLDTNARAPTPVQLAGWQQGLDQLAGGLSAADYQAALLDLLVAPEHRQRLAGPVIAMGERTGPARLARQLRLQQTRVDELADLHRVRVPTLVLHGELDALCPADRHREIARAIPQATLVPVAGSGHLSPLEAPQRVATAMAAWFTC